MRRSNGDAIDRFLLAEEQLLSQVKAIRASGINVVLLQGGETTAAFRLIRSSIPKILQIFEGEVEVLLNLGRFPREMYQELFDAGAKSYILKHETANPQLHYRMRGETLSSRIASLQDLIEVGFKVGSGSITGLPGQTTRDIAEDILFSREYPLSMCSASPFIPAPDTPLSSESAGSIELTLNTIAILRVLTPHLLIPSVSALEQACPGTQLRGLQAGANVMTINFSEEEARRKYLIYGKKRHLVEMDYVRRLADSAGLELAGSTFLDRQKDV
jgi:biotin synthase